MSLTSEHFHTLMEYAFAGMFDDVPAIAVGVSGGADSMAFLSLLQEWCAAHGKILHALSVNHGLREAAKDECAMVEHYCQQYDHVQHQTLQWDDPSNVRVQEEARRARYDLMGGYCQEKGISHLFLAHHADDQAETVLFRLAKGSGLDGLAGIRNQQGMNGVTLCRPLLDVAKEDLIEFCEVQDIPYIDDPSNDADSFARVRLRQSMDVLA